MEYSNELYIKSKTPLEEMLAGLAEEAAELAQAALKYRRAITGTNPTPMTQQEARMRFLEELADVKLYMELIEATGDDLLYMMDCSRDKERRWVERLREANNSADR